MIDVLIAGRLRGGVTMRTSANGVTYYTFRISAAGQDGESVLVSCAAFNKTVMEGVQRLEDGDSIAVTGEATLSTWVGKDGTRHSGLSVTVHGVLSAYHAGRKRQSASTGGTAETMEAAPDTRP